MPAPCTLAMASSFAAPACMLTLLLFGSQHLSPFADRRSPTTASLIMLTGALIIDGPGEWDWTFGGVCSPLVEDIQDHMIIDCQRLLHDAMLDLGESQSKNLRIWKKAKKEVRAVIEKSYAAAALRMEKRMRLRSKLGSMAASLAVKMLAKKKQTNNENEILAATTGGEQNQRGERS